MIFMYKKIDQDCTATSNVKRGWFYS